MKRRVVITSSGFFSPLGNSGGEVIAAMREGRVAFEHPEFAPEVITASVKDFKLKEYTGRYKNARYLNRGASFGLAAALKAVKDSGLTEEMLAGAGLFTGVGPNLDLGGEIRGIEDGVIDAEGMSALWILKFLPNTAASAIASLTGVHGENLTLSTACATTAQVIGEAYRKIRDGYLDVALAGGGDSRVNPGSVMAYKMAGALSDQGGDPQKEHRPFDQARSGFVIGEGGGFFVLEELSHAKNRGARILGEVCGFGVSMDGGSMTAPDPTGKWIEKAVRGALDEAGILPAEVDAVSAHGTGTRLNDAMEVDLLHRVFGDQGPMVMALKSWIGHLSTACGAVELAICLALMKEGFVPKVRNLDDPCSPHLNFIRENRDVSFGTVLLENFGFGGQNAALVVKAWKE